MDPKTIEINNLRVLNDYLNQTIDALVRGQRSAVSPIGAVYPGLSHSPYGVNVAGQSPFAAIGQIPAGLWHTPYAASFAAQSSPFAMNGVAGLGAMDATYGGLSHTPYAAASTFGFPSAMGFSPVIDPFLAQRGLSHSAATAQWSPMAQWSPTAQWSPAAELARQSQITQAMAARQQVLEALLRTAGIPV